MKRVIVSLLIGLTLTGLAAAQSAGMRSFRQIGAATAELNTDQLVASHPSLSMGTQLKVTNTANGKEAIVTVTGRIPASGTRVIDLSRGASARLEMNASGTTPVTIEVVRNTELAAAPPPPPPPEPEPVKEEPVVVAREEPVREAPKETMEEKPRQESASAPAPITIYNTITVAPKTPAEPVPVAVPVSAVPAPAQTIPVIVAPVFKAVPAPVIVTAPVYSQAAVPACPPAVPVKVLVTPVQPQVQAPCPPAQASVVYSASSQVVYSQAPAYRQVQPQQVYVQPQIQAPAGYTQPQASYQQPPAQPSQMPVTVYTTSSSTAQAPVTVYTATVPAAQASATIYTAPSQTPGGAVPSGVGAAIKPRMPDPASSGVYRVQVGSYADPQNAQVVAESLVRAGLSPAYEQYGQVWRVVIPGISARQLSAVSQQLGALGIGEVWIRQEG